MPLPAPDFDLSKFLALKAEHDDWLLHFRSRSLQGISLLGRPPRYSVPHGLSGSLGRQRRRSDLEMLPVAALETGVLNAIGQVVAVDLRRVEQLLGVLPFLFLAGVEVEVGRAHVLQELSLSSRGLVLVLLFARRVGGLPLVLCRVVLDYSDPIVAACVYVEKRCIEYCWVHSLVELRSQLTVSVT